MLRIGISVEGATEREFVNQLIMPYFSKWAVLITPVSMNGNISLDRIRHELPPLLGSFELHEADKQNQIEAIVQGAGAPERINDGVESCPSKRLKALFPHYDKKYHGPSICQRIGLSKIRRACPRFNGWLIRLENLTSIKIYTV